MYSRVKEETAWNANFRNVFKYTHKQGTRYIIIDGRQFKLSFTFVSFPWLLTWTSTADKDQGKGPKLWSNGSMAVYVGKGYNRTEIMISPVLLLVTCYRSYTIDFLYFSEQNGKNVGIFCLICTKIVYFASLSLYRKWRHLEKCLFWRKKCTFAASLYENG